jgi:hypothetical protein
MGILMFERRKLAKDTLFAIWDSAPIKNSSAMMVVST